MLSILCRFVPLFIYRVSVTVPDHKTGALHTQLLQSVVWDFKVISLSVFFLLLVFLTSFKVTAIAEHNRDY